MPGSPFISRPVTIAFLTLCWLECSLLSSELGISGLAASRTRVLHGDHKVLDSSGQPFKSGDDPSDFEDASHNDALRSFVSDLVNHGPWDGEVKKEKKRFDAVRHRISKIHRVDHAASST